MYLCPQSLFPNYLCPALFPPISFISLSCMTQFISLLCLLFSFKLLSLETDLTGHMSLSILFKNIYQASVLVFSIEKSESVGHYHVQLFSTPWTAACQAICPWNSPGKNTGVGCHSLSSGDLPDPGIELGSPALHADSLPSEPPGKP